MNFPEQEVFLTRQQTKLLLYFTFILQLKKLFHCLCVAACILQVAEQKNIFFLKRIQFGTSLLLMSFSFFISQFTVNHKNSKYLFSIINNA